MKHSTEVSFSSQYVPACMGWVQLQLSSHPQGDTRLQGRATLKLWCELCSPVLIQVLSQRQRSEVTPHQSLTVLP